ncbi:MAG: DUF6036 family nucleotidyltransferase [Clostridiales bacterium]|nr:DUF6036 family nucleotidyltransferase [Clostridiales bacterium]
MSSEIMFTKDNLDKYLKELGKEFRKLNGTKMPAEIILIGGAAVLARYGFREMTYDVDAVILASSVMKEAINHVGDRFGLPHGWLNMDFKRTKSFSDKLAQVSVYYRMYSNVLTIRTIAAEYLIAMKLMSGRQYKNDLSDVAGILWEHQKNNDSISIEVIYNAIELLYKDHSGIPVISKTFIDDAFSDGNFERTYRNIRESEKQARQDLLNFERDYPKTLKAENIDSILEQARKKRVNSD